MDYNIPMKNKTNPVVLGHGGAFMLLIAALGAGAFVAFPPGPEEARLVAAANVVYAAMAVFGLTLMVYGLIHFLRERSDG